MRDVTFIEDHVGTRAFVLASGCTVVDLRVDGALVRGRVVVGAMSAEEAVVRLRPSAAPESRCSCPMRGRCMHVAATLLEWRRRGGASAPASAFAVEVPPRAAGKPLAAWMSAHLSPALVQSTVQAAVGRHVVVPPGSWPWWSHWSTRLRVGELADPAGPSVDPVLREVILDALPALAADLLRAARYVQEARAWRDVPPTDARLMPLWRALRPELDTPAAATLTITGASEWPEQEFLHLDDPEMAPLVAETWANFGVQLGRSLVDADGAISLQFFQPLERVALAGFVIDVVFREPEFAKLRERLAVALSRPAWSRCVARLDRLLSEVSEEREAAEVTQDAVFGWKVDRAGNHPLRVLPVELTPYKRKSGYRSKRAVLPQHAIDQLERAGDRAALAEVTGDPLGPGAFRALRHLVGHPRVIDEDGALVVVQERALALRVSDEGEVLRLVPSFGAEPISPSLWPQLLIQRQHGVVAVIDPVARAVTLAVPGVAALELIYTLAEVDFRLPSDARVEVQRRLEAIERYLPLQLDASMRGKLMPREDRPLLRLELLGEEGLAVDIRVRPLPGGPTLVPGSGPRELARRTPGGREYVVRDLDEEVARVERALRGLPLEGREGWSAALIDPDAALELVAALQEHEAELLVEWATPKPNVSRAAQASDLRVRTRSAKDWFRLEGELEVDGVTVPLADLLQAIRQHRAFVKVTGDRWVRLSEALQQALEGPARLSADGKGELGALGVLATLRPLEQGGAQLLLPEELRELEGRIRGASLRAAEPPAGLLATLRPYQLTGFQWLDQLAHWSRGACLADDMGLGKTIQALALLLQRAPLGASLVVAPASVLINWEREAARFAPSLQFAVYAGSERAAQLSTCGPGMVLVCSYEVLARDIEGLAAVRFGTVVFDEAQALKNPTTQRARAAAELGAGFHLALTGTPVENRVAELWSLFRVIAPGLLGASKPFVQRFVQPIEAEGDEGARRTLSSLVAPFLLRRLKRDVAPELPPRTERIEYVSLSPDEQSAYDEMRAAAVIASNEGEADRMQVLAAITRLRQLACATHLVHPDAPMISSKIARLVELVRSVRESGEQALVFSQFVQLLKLVREALEAEGVSLRYLDGSTPREVRQREIDAFQAGSGDAFLISLQAGGTGLNLTAATWVFHLDPWWNPAKEDQATDRAHRIGQDRPVNVVRLVSAGTIEERVIALHAEKRELAEALVGGDQAARVLGSEEILALLRDEVAAPSGRAPVVEAYVQAATPSAEEPAVEDPMWSRHDALIARFDAMIQGELASGRLKTAASARNYVLAVQRLASFAEARGGGLETLADLRSWSARYLQALETGELKTGRSDKVFGPAAYRRLEEVWTGA